MWFLQFLFKKPQAQQPSTTTKKRLPFGFRTNDARKVTRAIMANCQLLARASAVLKSEGHRTLASWGAW